MSTPSTTVATYVPCDIWPLVFSRFDNPIQDVELGDEYSFIDLSQCGLDCTEGKLVYGLSKSEQSLVDAFKVIGTTICFIAILFLFVNQILDQKFSSEKFWDKPLLHHCPYFVSGSVFGVMVLMTIGEVIGKDSIVCNLDDENDSMAFFNPIRGSHNGGCTVQGILFYSSLFYYMSYTILLAFTIFRTFYRPNNPLFGVRPKMVHLGVLGLCVLIDIIIIATSSLDGIYPMGVCLPGPGDKNALLWFVTLPMCITSVASAVFLIAAIWVVRSNMLSGSKKWRRSVGASMAGGKGPDPNEKSSKASKHGFQISRSNTPVASAGSQSSGNLDLDIDERARAKEEAQRKKEEQEYLQMMQFRDLVKRMTLYACGVVGTFALLGATGIAFYRNHDALRDGMKKQIKCSIGQTLGAVSSETNCEEIDRETLDPFWFISWIIACLSSVLAQLILSCHVASKERMRGQNLTRVGLGLDIMPMGLGGIQGIGQTGMVRANTNSLQQQHSSHDIETTQEREKSALHGAEGYRTEEGTIIGPNRRITEVGDELPYITNSNNREEDDDALGVGRLSMIGMPVMVVDDANEDSPKLPPSSGNVVNGAQAHNMPNINEDETYRDDLSGGTMGTIGTSATMLTATGGTKNGRGNVPHLQGQYKLVTNTHTSTDESSQPTLPVPTGSAGSLITSNSNITQATLNASRSTQMLSTTTNSNMDQLSHVAQRGDLGGGTTADNSRTSGHDTHETGRISHLSYRNPLVASPSSAHHTASFTNFSNVAAKGEASRSQMTSDSRAHDDSQQE